MTTSPFLGLRLPELEDYFSLDGHWNYNSLLLDEFLANVNNAITQISSAIAGLSAGVRLLGAVNYYGDLPASPEDGDAYTVLYAGDSGTEPLGIEYVYTKVGNVYQWVPLGVDPAVFARQSDLVALQTTVAGKQDALTFDAAPTAGSDNPVKSKGIATAIAGEAAAREASDAKHDAALIELIDSGAKNTLDLSPIASQTINGITWTVDAASGTVTANGTATADSFFFVLPRDSNVEYSYPTVLSGCPAGGSQSIYEIQAQIGSSSYRDFGSTVNVPAGTIRYIACAVRKNQVANDLVFYPMLCSKAADAISHAFVPYCPPPAKMYAMIQGGAT